MKNFSVEAVVACDDVRKEVSQKDLLIGAYPDGINIFTLPSPIIVAFWVQLNCLKNQEKDILYLHAEGPDGIQGPIGKFELGALKKGTSFALLLPAMPYLITKIGSIAVKIKEESGEWQEIKRLRVENHTLDEYLNKQ